MTVDTDLGTDREIDEGTDRDTGQDTGQGAGRRERLLAALPWVVVVAALALAVVGGRAWWHAEHDPDLDRAAQRDAALIAARTHVATLTTLDGADVDAGLEAWGEATTGLLHDQVTGVDDTNREMLTDIGSTSVGRVVDAAVLELDGPTATVLVSVEVSVAELDAPGAEPTVKRNRFAADLRLVDDEWLLEDLQQVAVTL